MTAQTPKLVQIGPGKWVNPAFVTAVEDAREPEQRIGPVTISTVGQVFHFECYPSSMPGVTDKNKEADYALKQLGLLK